MPVASLERGFVTVTQRDATDYYTSDDHAAIAKQMTAQKKATAVTAKGATTGKKRSSSTSGVAKAAAASPPKSGMEARAYKAVASATAAVHTAIVNKVPMLSRSQCVGMIRSTPGSYGVQQDAQCSNAPITGNAWCIACCSRANQVDDDDTITHCGADDA